MDNARRKPIAPLADQCLALVYDHVFDYCTYLFEGVLPDKTEKALSAREFMLTNLPSTLHDALLQMSYRKCTHDSIRGYYFNKIVLHQHIKSFEARHHSYPLSYWHCLFSGDPFLNMRDLNLSLSCSDDLLKLVPERFPNLEILNATCKLVRYDYKGNAPYFGMAVTDRGLAYLSKCRKLRQLIVNEARSQSHRCGNSITHSGFRKLLRDVPTIEDLSYSDSGNVLAKDMEDVVDLNLRKVRHYNATVDTLKEIFRLCPLLQTLIIFFFNEVPTDDIIDTLLRNPTPFLQVLEFHNLHPNKRLHELLAAKGENLIYLALIESWHLHTFEQLLIIGQECPNMQHICIVRVSTSTDTRTKVKNFGQFSKLQSLEMVGVNMDMGNVLAFFTENAKQLEFIKISEREDEVDADHVFLTCINPQNVRFIETSANVNFSKAGVRRMVNKYQCLQVLRVHCPEDCTDLEAEFKENRLNCKFINESDVFGSPE